MIYRNLPALHTISIALHAFGALAQMITPAPIGPGKYAKITKRLRTDASFLMSAMHVCWSTGGACGSSQINLHDACTIEYQGSFDYLWCLCTTGYYDSLDKCSSCEASVGLKSTDFLVEAISSHKSGCDERTSTMKTKSPQLFGADGKLKTGSDAIAVATASENRLTPTATSKARATSDDTGMAKPTVAIIDELIPAASTSTRKPLVQTENSAGEGFRQYMVGFAGLLWAFFIFMVMLM
ncbi:hypothetical protein BZA77DRAFT_130329 [Pyronema omphalodes]|nr:hypothetical protein BZA77DRAFT_130329 [Pyronema omphalodes]